MIIRYGYRVWCRHPTVAWYPVPISDNPTITSTTDTNDQRQSWMLQVWKKVICPHSATLWLLSRLNVGNWRDGPMTAANLNRLISSHDTIPLPLWCGIIGYWHGIPCYRRMTTSYTISISDDHLQRCSGLYLEYDLRKGTCDVSTVFNDHTMIGTRFGLFHNGHIDWTNVPTTNLRW